MRRMDEMEVSINLKSIKVAWVYTAIFLCGWTVYDWTKTETIGLPFILLISQNMVLIGTELFLKWRINRYEE